MDTPALYATAWAILPPLVAIVLALITKEVYSSLFVGILVGGTMFLFGEELLSLYAPGNAPVIAMGMKRVTVMGLIYFLCVIMEVGLGMLRGMGQSMLPTVSTFVGTILLRIGWVLVVFPLNPCLESLYWSFPISWVLTAIFNYICCYIVFKKSKREYEQHLAEAK